MKHITVYLLFACIPVMAADFPELKGWEPAGQVTVYDADNLWEYINGAAEQFIAYGFERLLSKDISREQLVVTVDIYDMGSVLNAFGMFSLEKPDTPVLEIGGGGVVSPPYQCLLYKDRFYVKINTYEGEFTESSGRELLEALAESLPGRSGIPDEIGLLPEKDRAAGSEGYARESFLGLSRLNNCLYARYENKNTYQIFIMLLSEQEAESLWKDLESGWENRSVRGDRILVRSIPYRGMVGIKPWRGKLIGVADIQSEKELIKLLRSLE